MGIQGLTRRAFLLGLPQLVTPRVVVVGAGLAGLTCAHKLAQQNIPCTLYEATHRIGGRVTTDTTSFPIPVDMGGEMVGANHHYLRALAAELEVPLERAHLRLGPMSNAFKRALDAEPTEPASRETQDDCTTARCTVAQWLTSQRTLSATDRRWVHQLCPVLTGVEAEVCDASYFVQRVDAADDWAQGIGYDDRIKGGAERLVRALRTPPVHFGHTLQAVTASGTQYVLSFAQREVIADVVVLATPAWTRLRLPQKLPTPRIGTLTKTFQRVDQAQTQLANELRVARTAQIQTEITGGQRSALPYVCAAFGAFPTTAGGIVFAGEHTAEAYPGTMEGAVESGERAAADVVRICSRRR